MIYCLSDIHGEASRFRAMLKKIRFSKTDTLYVLGDVIDRRPGGVAILEQIMRTPNMVMLMGNHERMCLDTIGPCKVYGGRELWQENGGSCTWRELIYRCTPIERNRILRFLMNLPDHMELEVRGKRFYLVHACPSIKPMERLWKRPDPHAPAPFPDRTVIVGHTPTCFFDRQHEGPLRIWYGNGLIDLDCGCGHREPRRRLACLRLDDMREFYV